MPGNSAFYATRPSSRGRGATQVNTSPLLLPLTAGHFLYVDDGSCPDIIDVYKTTTTGLLHVGAFFTGGCNSSTLFGTQDIAVTPANGTHVVPCLVYTDYFHGLIESFPLSPTTGLPSSLASRLLNSRPIDVHISQDGSLTYVNSLVFTSALASYSLGAGCTLTALTKLATTHFYVSFALASLTRLLTVDSHTGTIDTYALTPAGGISLLNSVPGQISVTFSSAPNAVAVQTSGGTDVFTGQATLSRPEAQGGQENFTTGTINFLTGSPASDPNIFSSDGSAVLFDNTDSLLIQAEQYSNTLAVYSVTAGSPGSMTFLERTSLSLFGGSEPSAFAQLGSVLFVNTDFFGAVEACQLSGTGVSGCVTLGLLSNPNGVEAGTVVL
jgi:hypothetical protein